MIQNFRPYIKYEPHIEFSLIGVHLSSCRCALITDSIGFETRNLMVKTPDDCIK